jgi:hypothetical protein
MAQIMVMSGSTKKAKIAIIIQKAKNQARILFILTSKNKPKTKKKIMISPWAKKWSSSFILVGNGVVFSASSAEMDFPRFLTIANN